MKEVRKTIRLSREMSDAIDKARGDVSWSRWVERALERALDAEKLPPTPLPKYAPRRNV